MRQPPPDAGRGPRTTPALRQRLPARFWVFAGFALLYGMVETINGNWATVYMSSSLGASPPSRRWP